MAWLMRSLRGGNVAVLGRDWPSSTELGVEMGVCHRWPVVEDDRAGPIELRAQRIILEVVRVSRGACCW